MYHYQQNTNTLDVIIICKYKYSEIKKSSELLFIYVSLSLCLTN